MTRRTARMLATVAALVGAAVLAALVGAALAVATGHDAPRVCVSAVGPVDENGQGDTVPAVAGDCP